MNEIWLTFTKTLSKQTRSPFMVFFPSFLRNTVVIDSFCVEVWSCDGSCNALCFMEYLETLLAAVTAEYNNIQNMLSIPLKKRQLNHVETSFQRPISSSIDDWYIRKKEWLESCRCLLCSVTLGGISGHVLAQKTLLLSFFFVHHPLNCSLHTHILHGVSLSGS